MNTASRRHLDGRHKAGVNSRKKYKPIGTCRVCRHYGWLSYRWICLACESWERGHRDRDTCPSCGQHDMALAKGHCRGCWKEAAHRAGPFNTKPLFGDGPVFDSHQLMIAGIPLCSPPGHQKGRPQFPKSARDPSLASADIGQAVLLSAAECRTTPRQATAGGERRLSTKPSPLVGIKLGTFWTVRAVDQYAHAHGWPPTFRRRAQRTLIKVLEALEPGEELTQRSLRLGGGPANLLTVALRDLGYDVAEDRPWLAALIQRRTAGLPPGYVGDVAAWMTALHDGTSRSRPKTTKTVLEYSRNVGPALLGWGRRYEHLREVTADDVRAALAATPAGSARRNTFVAHRSLFGFLRRENRIFANPTTRIHLGARNELAILPLSAEQYGRVIQLAITPLHRVVLVLVAVHGARPGAVLKLRLDEVDLAARELTIAGVTRQLDDLSYRTLRDYLTYRRSRWPRSANPHLILSDRSAYTEAPATRVVFLNLFQGSGVTLDQLRMDRNLEEALAYGPDPLHLQSLFGISEATAIRYASQARRILDTTYDDSPRSPRRDG